MVGKICCHVVNKLMHRLTFVLYYPNCYFSGGTPHIGGSNSRHDAGDGVVDGVLPRGRQTHVVSPDTTSDDDDAAPVPDAVLTGAVHVEGGVAVDGVMYNLPSDSSSSSSSSDSDDARVDNDWVFREDDDDFVDARDLGDVPPLEADNDTATDFVPPLPPNHSDDDSSDEDANALVLPRPHCLDLPASDDRLLPEGDFGPITVRQSRVVMFAAAQRHAQSLSALQTSLDIVGLFLPHEVEWDTNIKRIKHTLGYDPSLKKTFYYCKKCFAHWPEDEGICICGSLSREYFVINDLQRQLEMILNHDGMWELIKQFRRRNDITPDKVHDITDASVYRKLRLPGGFLSDPDVCNLTLTFSEDAVRVHKTPKSNLDVMSFIINDIPPKLRTKRRNMLLFGLWQSRAKCEMNTFVGPAVDELERLYLPDKGLIIRIGDTVVRARLKIIQFTMDLMARSPFTGMTTHRGDSPCISCEDKGVMIDSVKKAVAPTAQPPADGDEAVRPPARARTSRVRTFEQDVQGRVMRTTRSVQRHAHIAQMFKDNGEVINACGFTSYPPIFKLSYFDVDMFGYDCLHMIWLNIMKGTCEYIFKTDIVFKNAKNRNAVRKLIDDIVLKIKPTNNVSRLPRSLKSYDGFKGSEMRFLGLYALPVAMKGLVPKKVYEHFLKLMDATWLLHQEEISEDDFTRADELLLSYSKEFSTTFERVKPNGDRLPAASSINVHGLEHLVANCRKFGPGYCSDTSPFESNYGQIVKGLHSTSSVLDGTNWNDYCHKLCAQEAVRAEGKVKLVLCSFTRQTAYVTSHKTDDCHVLGHLKGLDDDQRCLLERVGRQGIAEHSVASKIIRDGMYFDSDAAGRYIKCRNTRSIMVKPNTRGIKYLNVLYYIVNTRRSTVEAVCSQFDTVGYLHDEYCNYIFEVTDRENTLMTSVRYIVRPLIRIDTPDKIYLAVPANRIQNE